MKKDTQVLEKLFYQMSEEQELHFLSCVFQSMNTFFIPNLPGVAGVSFDKKLKLFKLVIDPDKFMALKSDKERVAILIHEVYHILHKHVFIPEEVIVARNRKQMNVALDLAINQLIKNLPDFACTIDKFRDKNKVPFKPNLTWEEYYDALEMAEIDKNKCSGQGDEEPQDGDEEGEGSGDGQGKGKPTKGKGKGSKASGKGNGEDWQPVNFDQQQAGSMDSMDSHEWTDADTKERLEATRDLIKRSIQKSSFTYSKIPDFVQDCLEKIEMQVKKLNYKELLLRALRNSLPSKDIERTWKRPSRRYGDIAKGNMSAKMPKLAVFIDTSGSISHEEANEFLKITNNFMTTGVSKADLHMFHTSIYFKEKIKKNFQVLPTSFQSGGTDLQEAMDVIAKKKPDLSIILTDGYYSMPNIKKGTPKSIVFIISKGGATNHPMSKLGVTVSMEK